MQRWWLGIKSANLIKGGKIVRYDVLLGGEETLASIYEKENIKRLSTSSLRS
jgi:hypothetical protein